MKRLLLTIAIVCIATLTHAQQTAQQWQQAVKTADSLQQEGNFKAAFELIETIPLKELQNAKELLTIGHIQYIYTWRYDTILLRTTLQHLKQLKIEDPKTLAEIGCFEASVLRVGGEPNKAWEVIQKAKALHTYDSLQLAFLVEELLITLFKGEYNRGIKWAEKHPISDSLKKKFPVLFGWISLVKGKQISFHIGHKEAIKTYSEGLTLLKKSQKRPYVFYFLLHEIGSSNFRLTNCLESREQLLNALKGKEKLFGKKHCDCENTLHNLGVTNIEIGNYSNAEKKLLKSLEIKRNYCGSIDEGGVSVNLNDLAQIYRNVGNYRKAEKLYLQSIEIYKNHNDIESALNYSNIGGLYFFDLGENEKAAPFLKRSENLHAKNENRNYSYLLEVYTAIYFAKKKLDSARLVILKRKEQLKKFPAKIHEIRIHEDLGKINLKEENLKEAEKHLLIAKKTSQIAGYKLSTLYSTDILSLLINLYQTQKSPKKLSEILTENNQLYQKHLTNGVAFMSAQELNRLQKLLQENIDRYWSNALFLLQEKATPSGNFYNMALLQKGFGLEAISSRQAAVAQADRATKQQYEQWQTTQRYLAAILSRKDTDSEAIEELQTKADSLEKALTRSIGSLDLQVPEWQQVQAALGKGEAAIEFVNHRYFSPAETDSVLYLALLLQERKEPIHIPLFEQKKLSRLLGNTHNLDFVNDLYEPNNRGLTAKDKVSLHDLIWKPIAEQLGADVHTIHLSPTGLLHRINLAAIPLSEEETLADRYQLNLITSTRRLANPFSANTIGTSATVFGGIDYEVDTTYVENIDSTNTTDYLIAGTRRSRSEDGWKYLRYTQKEGEAICEVLKTEGIDYTYASAKNATEEAFKQIGTTTASPRILHLATHGFFFPDQPDEEELANNFKAATNPMIRSGLLLAGANYAWKNGRPLPGKEDGILTAYEISQQNLRNTELVVLSACETGLGDIDSNEGVIGLQRAFKIAGVKYLIMSLWQVPDYQTQELMTTFYQKWLQDKMDIPTAFQTAQKEMREKYRNPYFWAGFVLVE